MVRIFNTQCHTIMTWRVTGEIENCCCSSVTSMMMLFALVMKMMMWLLLRWWWEDKLEYYVLMKRPVLCIEHALRCLNHASWCTYVRRTNEMHFFFINNLIQLYCLQYVSNSQVFIFRKTSTCSFMVLYHAEIIIKAVLNCLSIKY